MAWTVIAGVHHDELISQAMLPAKCLPALFVKPELLVGHWRNYSDFRFWNSFSDDSLFHEIVQRYYRLCMVHAALQ